MRPPTEPIERGDANEQIIESDVDARVDVWFPDCCLRASGAGNGKKGRDRTGRCRKRTSAARRIESVYRADGWFRNLSHCCARQKESSPGRGDQKRRGRV